MNCGAWDDACAGDYHNTLGNIKNPPTYKRRNDDTDHGSDADSVAELEYKTWEDACAWRCQSVLVHIPPGLVQNPPTDKIRNYKTNDMLDTDSVAELNYNAWDDACAGDYQNTLGNIQNPPTCKIRRSLDRLYKAHCGG